MMCRRRKAGSGTCMNLIKTRQLALSLSFVCDDCLQRQHTLLPVRRVSCAASTSAHSGVLVDEQNTIRGQSLLLSLHNT
jgi:hypothetical protein